jgi:hypothetical protein
MLCRALLSLIVEGSVGDWSAVAHAETIADGDVANDGVTNDAAADDNNADADDRSHDSDDDAAFGNTLTRDRAPRSVSDGGDNESVPASSDVLASAVFGRWCKRLIRARVTFAHVDGAIDDAATYDETTFGDALLARLRGTALAFAARVGWRDGLVRCRDGVVCLGPHCIYIVDFIQCVRTGRRRRRRQRDERRRSRDRRGAYARTRCMVCAFASTVSQGGGRDALLAWLDDCRSNGAATAQSNYNSQHSTQAKLH